MKFLLSILLSLAALLPAHAQRGVLYDTNYNISLPTNILGMRVGGQFITNLAGFGLVNSNGNLSVDTSVITNSGSSTPSTTTSNLLQWVGGAHFVVTNNSIIGDVSASELSGVITNLIIVGTGQNDQVLEVELSFASRATNYIWSFQAEGGANGFVAYEAAGYRTDTLLRLALHEAAGSIYFTGGYWMRFDLWERVNVSSGGSGGGTGSVTSVALTAPSMFSVGGSPVTTSGTLALSLATQTANTVLAGPTTGGAATPTFRALVDGDIPNTITIDLAAVATVANSGDSATAFFSSGTIEDARIDSAIARDAEMAALYQPLDPDLTTLATLNGGSLTNLNGSAIASGTVAEARIDSAIARLDSPSFTGTVSFEVLQADAVQLPFASGYASADSSSNMVRTLDGGSWTNLNASQISAGTLAEARVDAAIARLASPTFTGTPSGPTASVLSSNTVLATTAYADRAAADAAAAMGGGAGTNYLVLPITSLASTSPADSTTYFVGFTNFRTSYAQAYSVLPISGTIIRFWVRIVTNGTVASSENVDYYLRLNDTTDFGNFTDTWDAAYVESTSASFTQAVSAGDQIAIKIVTPVWTTNPTTAYAFGWVLIEY